MISPIYSSIFVYDDVPSIESIGSSGPFDKVVNTAYNAIHPKVNRYENIFDSTLYL